MAILTDMAVSLAEVVEVRGCPLADDHVWALLVAGVPALQSLADRVTAGDRPLGLVTPETVLLQVDGSVIMACVLPAEVDGVYLPPEFRRRNSASDSQPNVSAALVYGFGRVLLSAMEISLDSADRRVASVSADLLSLLNLMTVADDGSRPTLSKLAHMAKQQAASLSPSAADVVRSMHAAIMGTEDELEFAGGSDSVAADDMDTAPAAVQMASPTSSSSSHEFQVHRATDAAPLDDTDGRLSSTSRTSSESAASDTAAHNLEQREPPTADSAVFDDFKLDGIGSPIGNSTKLTHLSTIDESAWVSFEAEKDTATDGFSSSLDGGSSAFVESTSAAAEAAPYDRLVESHDTDPFISERAAADAPAVKATTTVFERLSSLGSNFGTPRDHGAMEPIRSWHSLSCHMCPRKIQPGSIASPFSRSSPNIAVDLCPRPNQSLDAADSPVRRSLAPNGEDPFASFENLKNADDAPRGVSPKRVRVAVRSESGSSSGETEQREFFNIAAPHEERRASPVPKPRHNKVKAPQPTDSDAEDALAESASAGNRTPPTPAHRPTPPPRHLEATAIIQPVPDRSAATLPVDSTNGSVASADVERRVSTGEGRLDARPRAPPSRRAMVGPEFLHTSRMPSIRLKAPASKKRKLLQRAEAGNVLVVLLSGQKVDVACRTDCLAGDVFDLVVAHTNLSEHYFFGLTVLRDGEHFFLESDQKLSKLAPPGWRRPRKGSQAKCVYTIYLRLKFYPTTLDSIRTGQTLHEMYLQLRRDTIDERMQTERDAAYQLAALALQAEYGDRPDDSTAYFQPSHYLPHRRLTDEPGGEGRIASLLAELHSQYAGLQQLEAENEYLRMSQQEREYGIHFHRLYRSKPALHLGNTPLGDPDTGTPLWIGILPRGIIVFEDRGGQRVPITQHPWHLTLSLKYDRKRFIVVPQSAAGEGADAPPHAVYYTDDHKKSSYFVKFAAAQHRFCIKMRSKPSTLEARPESSATLPRVRVAAPAVIADADDARAPSAKSSDSGVNITREASPDDDVQLNDTSTTMDAPKPLDVSIPTVDRTVDITANGAISESLAGRLNDMPAASPLAEAMASAFDVRLVKDPRYGLGLTLVDGEIHGQKGVYVKSLTPGGPAELQGRLRVGDRLLAINEEPLEGLSRHDAVNLVKQSPVDVQMRIARIKGLCSSSSSSSEESVASADDRRYEPKSRVAAVPSKYERRTRSEITADVYERAATNLPALSTENIFARELASSSSRLDAATKSATLPDKRDGVRLGVARRPPRESSVSSVRTSATSASSASRLSGEYPMPRAGDSGLADPGASFDDGLDDIDPVEPAAAATNERGRPLSTGSGKMYQGLGSDSEDESRASPSHQRAGSTRSTTSDEKIDYGANPFTEVRDFNKPSSDWVDNINQVSSNEVETSVTLEKNDKGGLGIKIAGKHDRIYIKALVSNPALSCPDLRIGDRLTSVNGRDTMNMSHHDVVSLLKDAPQQVTLGLLRPVSPSTSRRQSHVSDKADDETLSVTLEKPVDGSLGLSLSRTAGCDGIYIRTISAGSAAALDGRLRVNDRLWQLNGTSLTNATPFQVVEMLKAADGFIDLVVKREKRN